MLSSDKQTNGRAGTSSMFSKESIANAGQIAKRQITQVKDNVKAGNFSIRLLALIGGIALIGSSILGTLQNIANFEMPSTLVEVYTFILGVIMLILESRQLMVPQDYMKTIYHYALFLKFVWGRGLLYFVAGSLQAMQGRFLDFLVGAYVMTVGLLYIILGRRAALKLGSMRQFLYSEREMRAKFDQADVRRVGALSLDEFGSLTDNIGMSLDHTEKEAIFLHLDHHDKGEVNYDDLVKWWAQWDDDAQSVV